ncbi:MAG: sulfur carrier protein ThiS [Dysgonamonadaceae bacterium]|nr:sulfur carrier protein ThiS [Dysgonamonadaceae bacterium]
MKIILNDKPYAIAENTTLAAFIAMLELKPEGIAIAINNHVVPKDRWAKTRLTDKMELTLIHAVSGG